MPRTVVGVLAAMAFAGVIAYTAVGSIAAISAIRGGSPTSAPTGTESEYRTLAERLLAPPYPNPDGSLTTLTLYPAALPPAQPDQSAIPPGATLIGSTVRTRGTHSSVGVVLDVAGDPTAVADFYKRELASRGYAPMTSGPGPQGGGFVSTLGPANTTVFCKGATDPSINVTVWTRPGSANDVRINYEPIDPRGGGYGPCNQPPRGGPGMGMDRLPSIRPPDGVVLQQSGGSSGGNRQASEATATTTRTTRELEAHFAQQLAAAGWTRTGSGADATLAWSTWKVPGDGAWQGVLVIYEAPGKDRRGLLLRAEG